MSSLNSLNRNVIRISGLNSGLDTDAMVKAMMTSTKSKVDKQYRSQVKMEWAQQSNKDINNELRKLKDEFTTVLKADQNMLSEYNYRKYTTKMNNTSDSAYVSITTEPYANESSITIDSVKQLAKAASSSSADRVTGATGTGLNLSHTLQQISDQLEAAGKQGFSFSDTNESGKTVSFQLDGKEFNISAYATLDSAIGAINANSENMKLSYTQLTDKFTLSSRTSGAASTLNMQDSSFLSVLGITAANKTQGQDAILTIDGQEITRDSNSFTVDGVNYNLKKTFNETNAQDGKKVLFSIERDVESTLTMIEKYVDAYNTLVTKLNGLINEKVERSYQPLTDEDKESLTEKQIEQIETKAKQGLMRNNAALSTLMSDMRMSFYTKVPGTSLMMADIGIGGVSVGATQYDDALIGKMNFDVVKVRESLLKNPDQIFAMFTAKDEGGDIDKMGLASRISTVIDRYIKNNEATTQAVNTQQIYKAQKTYNSMVTNMYAEEDRLWAKFTAMETAMSKLNSQSTWIGQQMA